MIKDDNQYEYSKECAKRFAYSIELMEKDEATKINDPDRWEVSRSSLQCHLDSLQSEIEEYERLINCDKNQSIQIQFSNIHDFLDALVKARIAAKISQQELADILGIDESRIKLCEDNNYRCATVSEIIQVIAALGIEFEDANLTVDFELIESGKNNVLQLRKWREERSNIKAKAS